MTSTPRTNGMTAQLEFPPESSRRMCPRTDAACSPRPHAAAGIYSCVLTDILFHM
ncbi:hypothetical protein BV22DRAFT_756042 [Leucogyrophana mollusca]|uniref:Uncharacterized protein n=1 Tax=Leucogyrophana mollusca TaxID=85980 RepID=A0ACB8B5P6_9AGAM|nr:hypothetical protein BV22DRAFT_756042 [Leucogyrophana mollusca]